MWRRQKRWIDNKIIHALDYRIKFLSDSLKFCKSAWTALQTLLFEETQSYYQKHGVTYKWLAERQLPQESLSKCYPLEPENNLKKNLAPPEWQVIKEYLAIQIPFLICSGLTSTWRQDDTNNKAIQCKGFSENEDKDHPNKEFWLLCIGSANKLHTIIQSSYMKAIFSTKPQKYVRLISNRNKVREKKNVK